MKIYQHTGNGHYIGSYFTVIAQNRFDAELYISQLLLNHGLSEELNIKEIEIKEGAVINEINGDY